jgi:hypothetical protein
MDSISNLVLDAALHDNLMLRDRIASLEADNESLRTTLSVALDQLRAAHLRDQHYKRRLRTIADAAQRVKQAA